MMNFRIPKAVKLTKAQRAELVTYVEKQCEEKIDKLKKSIPDEPNLSFYLSNAIVNGTVVFKSQESFLSVLQNKISGSYRGFDGVVNVREYSGEAVFNGLDVFSIFEMPEGYEEARKKYEEEAGLIAKTIQSLQENLKVVRLKIQVGSDEALQGLVSEIDNIGGALTIMGGAEGTNLLLSNPTS